MAPERAKEPEHPGLPAVVGELFSMITIESMVRAIPGAVRITTALVWRTNQWTVDASLHLGAMVVRGALAGQPAHTLIEEIGGEARRSVRELLGVGGVPDPMPDELRDRILSNGEVPSGVTLADRLNALLDASADLTYRETGHPAYVRMLSELAPDEARILRLFAQQGPQPAVDVRTRRPFGVGSQLIAPGITMIGRYAGCQHLDLVAAYLNNLFRLGLIWFSHEALPDKSQYDVLEAQEEVREALRRAGSGMTVRRRIELTAFGKNLCATTGLLPPDEGGARASRQETTRQLSPPDAR